MLRALERKVIVQQVKRSFASLLQEALAQAVDGPVLIDVPIDYKDNIKLGETILPDEFY